MEIEMKQRRYNLQTLSLGQFTRAQSKTSLYILHYLNLRGHESMRKEFW